jgi:kynurenine formamidase
MSVESIQPQVPDKQEVERYLYERRNWGRWGDDDQVGAINLITPQKLLSALSIPNSGRVVTLSRPIPTIPGPGNPNPAQQWWKWREREFGCGWGTDFLAIDYHGLTCTHLDALNHTWDAEGMWNGRVPAEHNHSTGGDWGSVEHWRRGIITRGVILDVPRHRGTPYVTVEQPVHGWELEDVLNERGVTLLPGDAICVYSGRDRWQADHPDKPYSGYVREDGQHECPGLHASCLPFIRDNDVSTVVWDMNDALPDAYDMELPYTVHGAIHAYGVALLDNANLEELAAACVEEGRDEFLFLTVPLYMPGGTGSPVNPIAVL